MSQMAPDVSIAGVFELPKVTRARQLPRDHHTCRRRMQSGRPIGQVARCPLKVYEPSKAMAYR